MAFHLYEDTWETSTTTGTGAYALGGAASSGGITYRPFSAQYVNGDTCFYSAYDGTNWEHGLGTYNTGNTLSRTKIYRSSNANATVNWTAGTRQVVVTALGYVLEGALPPNASGVPPVLSSPAAGTIAAVVGPVTAGHVAIFNDGNGTIADGGTTQLSGPASSVTGDIPKFADTTGKVLNDGYTPTDTTKTKVVMAQAAAVTVGHTASFLDTTGTVGDSGARAIQWVIAGGTADALTGTFTPVTPTLGSGTDGYIWRVRATAANATTTPTFAPDGQGPWTIKKNNGQALIAGDISGAGHELLLSFNNNSGTPFIELLNPTQSAPPVSSVFGRTGAVAATSGDYSVSQVTGAAPLASPTFTGTPAAPTPTTADNSTKVATTAFVKNQGYITSAAPPTGYGNVGTYACVNVGTNIYSPGGNVSGSLIGLSGTWQCMGQSGFGSPSGCPPVNNNIYLFQRLS